MMESEETPLAAGAESTLASPAPVAQSSSSSSLPPGAVIPKDVTILETAEDIQERREQVLSRYGEFKTEARFKRDKLEDSRRFQVSSLII